ncbi:unnamed protein product [Haemonchus placei]|uniref:SWIM-type domain-containing protein n=1 Tax=Haemonchus placei TaxID=6290 RepID=A0A0N4VV03_HAEPC|nr:unnamed protein product [Haemonchus placei]
MGTVDVEKLFKEIKKLMPDFNPARIVTDEAMCFYSGFRSTFPQSTAKLHYCRWHISKSWEKKVRELVEPQHRAQVNMELKQLLLVGQLTDFQQRNANSRIDCLVELLIRAVEDLADSNEIKDRRRLAQASFRTQQTSIRHRSAQAQYQGKSEKITSIGIRKWEVEGRKPDAKFIVEDKGGCICPPNFGKNVHCPSCNVCPYSWTCSCLDNRAGISCVHRHAVKMFEDQNAPCGEEHSPAVMEEHEEIALRSTSSSVVSEVQSRMDMRKSIRNNIEMRYSVVSTNVNRLVNSDTQEACAKLLDIQNLIDQASKITLLSSSLEPRIAVRPELTRSFTFQLSDASKKCQAEQLIVGEAAAILFPLVYVKGEFVGGCDIMVQMHKDGEIYDSFDSKGFASKYGEAK